MKVVFKADDGTVFNSAEECVKYEAELTNKAKEWEGWNWSGESTDITVNAVVVSLPTAKSAAQFLAKADLDDDERVEGIYNDSRGWYYYDEGAEKYLPINEEIINVFQSISAS